MLGLTVAKVILRISWEEWRLHCWRRKQETALLVQDLHVTPEVPLLDSFCIQDIWSTQRRHLSCIQDPPRVQLYTETGRLTKGGSQPCGFHLNQFIPAPVPSTSKLLATPARQSRRNSELSSLPDTRRGSPGDSSRQRRGTTPPVLGRRVSRGAGQTLPSAKGLSLVQVGQGQLLNFNVPEEQPGPSSSAVGPPLAHTPPPTSVQPPPLPGLRVPSTRAYRKRKVARSCCGRAGAIYPICLMMNITGHFDELLFSLSLKLVST
ncbi:uncharacterized protein LOC111671835 [Seriola lalandi dorsalis]|uniref:uncharacterized protein LOC111671835 n=1 Tax=Seriola lalandi dorsalis TaxID=1841481 RepID=UPI000C6F8708|nr:uncharacterized protein LOC111671835 [Seriola lalandi dorsalis]